MPYKLTKLFDGDDSLFKDLLKNSKNYGEYGCGLSTEWVLNNTNANILSVDSSKEWIDKISSKNTLIKLINGEELKYKDLLIKSIKCSNSEFDDNPEIIAYLQVKDLKNVGNDEVFVFNGWTFSSSPSINTFDHPVYDLWLTKCTD